MLLANINARYPRLQRQRGRVAVAAADYLASYIQRRRRFHHAARIAHESLIIKEIRRVYTSVQRAFSRARAARSARLSGIDRRALGVARRPPGPTPARAQQYKRHRQRRAALDVTRKAPGPRICMISPSLRYILALSMYVCM